MHRGHLDVADAASRALGLDRVLFVPANVPPHRAQPRASAAHRFAMTALAVHDDDRFDVDDLEMLSDSPSFTAVTLDRLAARGVVIGELFVITGADAFRDIASWKDYPALLDRCHFVVVSRPGAPAPALRSALRDLFGRMMDPPCPALQEPRIVLVDAPTAPVSSTDIRRRVASGDPIDDMTPGNVVHHIRKHQLYRASSLYGQS